MFKLKDIFFFFKSTLWGSPSFDSKIVLDSLGKIIKKKKERKGTKNTFGEKETTQHIRKKKGIEKKKLPCRESNPGWPGESRPCYRLHHKGIC